MGKYYLKGIPSIETVSYKASICNNNTTVESVRQCIANEQTVTTDKFNVRLLRYREMFAAQQGTGYSNSIRIWLITRYSSFRIFHLDDDGLSSYVHPTIYLKSNVKFLECPSGEICDGTELHPYYCWLINKTLKLKIICIDNNNKICYN